jgi:hypothetical protein
MEDEGIAAFNINVSTKQDQIMWWVLISNEARNVSKVRTILYLELLSIDVDYMITILILF